MTDPFRNSSPGAALAPTRQRPGWRPAPQAEEGQLHGFEEATQQRVADLRTQLARAEEFAATLRERLLQTTAPARTP
ncbi:hypothetical protein [Streptomyces europaeiscabiei]|uniref:hypothetical protein n=1 Tax=Streptomyces europaeiscabiei TaxID=146819 RepID=UPI0038D3D774